MTVPVNTYNYGCMLFIYNWTDLKGLIDLGTTRGHIDMEAIKKVYGDMMSWSSFRVSPNDFSIILPHLHCHSARPIGMGYHIDVTKLGLQQNAGGQKPGTVTTRYNCVC